MSLPEIKGNTQFPSDLIDPAKKGKEWCMQYIRAAYAEWKRSEFFLTNRRYEYIENRKYAEGNQANLKYKRWLTDMVDRAGNPTGYLNIDEQIFSPIPKIRDSVLGYISKLDLRPQATALNPEFVAEKQFEKAKMKAMLQLKPFFDQLEQQGAPPAPGTSQLPFEAETEDELDLYLKTDFRLPIEIAMELGMSIVDYENEAKQVDKLMWGDAFDNGLMACFVGIDVNSRKIKYEYTDVVNVIYRQFRGSYCTSPYIGRIVPKTIAQLKMEAGDSFTKEEYENLEILSRNLYGVQNNGNAYGYGKDYINTDVQNWYYDDNHTIFVMELYWDSVDRMKFQKLNTDAYYGGARFLEKPFNAPQGSEVKEINGHIFERTIEVVDNPTVYMGMWVIGTEMIYNWGKLKDISRDQQNPKEVFKPIHLYRIANKSMLERIKPIADAIQLDWIKIQNEKAKAMPSGVFFDIKAVENMVMDGKETSVKELITMLLHTGSMPFRSTSTNDDDGYSRVNNPIIKNDGGMGHAFEQLANDITLNINWMKEVTGINEILAGGNIKPDAGLGVTDLALQGTQNALQPLIGGWIALKEKTQVDICGKLQLLRKYDGLEGYALAIGTTEVKYITVDEDIHTAQDGTTVRWGITLNLVGTEREMAALMDAARMALANTNNMKEGGIEIDDYMYIQRCILSKVNPKLIEVIIGKRIAAKKKRDAEAEMQKQQQVAQMQSQGAIALEQEKQKSAQLANELAISKVNAVADAKIRVAQTLYPLKTGEQQNKGEIEKEKIREKAVTQALAE